MIAYEWVLRSLFQPAKFNYVISGQFDTSLFHFHAFPRYDTPRTVIGRTFIDERWPKFLTFPIGDDESEEDLSAIARIIHHEAVEVRRCLK
jgi:hypothetical protein